MDGEGGTTLASSHPKKRTGRKKFKETRHPVYRGVRMRNSNRWVCEVREPNKRNRIWLGTYATAEMAARAHDVAALALKAGKGCCLNFADSAWRLPKPASADPEDIQRAAAEAAQMFSAEDQEDGEVEEGEEAVTTTRTPESGGGVKSAGESSSYGEQQNQTNELKFYYDMDEEESVFDMPGLLKDMAEGLLIPAPCYVDDSAEQVGTDTMLWSHSI